RTAPWSPRLRACRTNAAVGTLAPVAAARKSARCLSRSMATTPFVPWGASGAEPLASARAARGNHLASAFGRHAGTKAVTAFGPQLARLIGPLHGLFSAGLYGDDDAPLARRTDPAASPRPRLRSQWRGSPRPKSRGLYGRPPLLVNARSRGSAQAR